MKIAIYARKSKMSDTGESIQNQIEMCKAYITLYHEADINNIEVYYDEGFSGSNTKRPDFIRLLEDCAQNRIKMLICYRLDRVSRNIADFSNTYAVLEKNHVEFVSIKEKFDTSTPIGRAMLNISLVFSQLERETIAERIRDNLILLSQNGKWLGGTTPLGYSSEKITYLSGTKEKHCYELVLKEDERPTLETIFKKYLELGTISQVENYLIRKGIKTRNRKTFRANTIREILINPTYCEITNESYDYFNHLGCQISFPKGHLDGGFCFLPFNRCKGGKQNQKNEYREWILAQGTHKPIISADIWLLTQQLIQENGNNLSYNSHAGYSGQLALLTGLIYCHCGSRMKVTNHAVLVDGTISYIYRCNDKLRSRGALCNNKNLKGHYLDKIIVHKLIEMSDPSVLIQQLKKNQATILSDEPLNNPILSLELEIKLKEEKIDRLLDNLAAASDAMMQNTLLNKIKSLQTETTNLTSKLSDFKEQLPETDTPSINPQELAATLSDINHVFQNSSIAQKRRLIKQVINKIEFDGRTVTVLLNSLIPVNPSAANGSKITHEKR